LDYCILPFVGWGRDKLLSADFFPCACYCCESFTVYTQKNIRKYQAHFLSENSKLYKAIRHFTEAHMAHFTEAHMAHLP